MVKKDAVDIVKEKKADEITDVVREEKLMAEKVREEDVKADDVCVEDVRTDDVRADDMMAEDMRVESVRAESEMETAQDKEEVNQEDEGDITDTVCKDCEENTAHDECMLKVSKLDIV